MCKLLSNGIPLTGITYCRQLMTEPQNIDIITMETPTIKSVINTK